MARVSASAKFIGEFSLSADSATLCLTRVTCNVGHGHAQLVDMLDDVRHVDMCNMGDFQPNDLDDTFLRRCLANGCRDIVFPKESAAPGITDQSIFEFCFVNDPNHRPQRFLVVEGPTLSVIFVRDFVRVGLLVIGFSAASSSSRLEVCLGKIGRITEKIEMSLLTGKVLKFVGNCRVRLLFPLPWPKQPYNIHQLVSFSATLLATTTSRSMRLSP